VSELAKAKLEKPKRLSELASRWWNEIYAGTYLFDRQVRFSWALFARVLVSLPTTRILAYASRG
jgi:hypothetical protein